MADIDTNLQNNMSPVAAFGSCSSLIWHLLNSTKLLWQSAPLSAGKLALFHLDMSSAAAHQTPLHGTILLYT